MRVRLRLRELRLRVRRGREVGDERARPRFR